MVVFAMQNGSARLHTMGNFNPISACLLSLFHQTGPCGQPIPLMVPGLLEPKKLKDHGTA